MNTAQGMVVWLVLALLSGTIQPVIAADSNTNSRIQAAKLTDYVSVKTFGAKCDGVTDDTAALQKAVNTTPRILFPTGTCLLKSTVTLRAGTMLRGEGMKVSIVKQGGVIGTSMGTFYANSGAAGLMLAGIQITNMTIYGQSEVLGFSGFQHLVSLHGVKDVLVEKVEFRGFRGDGLYIGSGIHGGDERHNENITVRGSVFDGVNHSNRNGISIIDGNGVLIEGNLFKNTTQPNMPGAIDVEPNGNSFHVVKNITIRNNELSAIGGNVAAISLLFNSLLSVTPTIFRIEGNSIAGTNGGILFNAGVRPTATSIPSNLVIANNVVTTSGRSLVISGAKEFKVYGNAFSDANLASLIGYKKETDGCVNGVVSDNVFRNIKNVGLAIFSVENLEISRNSFIDIGNGAIGSYAIDFNAGTSSYIHLWDNIISSPSGKTAYAIQKETGHTFTPATNSARNNRLIGVSGNAFQAISHQ